MISLVNLSRGNHIGSNSYLLEMGRTRIVLDAGTHPKREGNDTLPDFSLLDYDSVDAVFLSHAHLDHSGALPVLMRNQPGARIFMSEATRALADALLHNSVNVMVAKREELNVTEYPLYTHRELDLAEDRWEVERTGRPFYVSSKDEITCEFFNAGHILGAMAALFEFQDHRVLYTGDVHFEDQTLSRGADLPASDIDTVIIETTRGSTERSEHYTRSREIDRLARAVNAILDRGGSVLIPIFAMGKTQELLIILHGLKEEGIIPNVPLHIGGLSTKMTMIYDRLANRTYRNYPGLQILKEIDLVISSSRKRTRQLEYHSRCIYALSSGMMTENTLSNRFARNFVENKRCGILFVGYADPESPAGAILNSHPGDRIRLDPKLGEQELRCSIDKFDFSGHATRESICAYLRELQPKNIVLVHGDSEALHWFQAELNRELPKSRVIIPAAGEMISLA